MSAQERALVIAAAVFRTPAFPEELKLITDEIRAAEAAAYARGLERAAQHFDKLDADARATTYTVISESGASHEEHPNGYFLSAREAAKALRALAGAEELTPAPGARAVLTELLRLYDWRFFLAEREKDPRDRNAEFRKETRRLLNKYGAEKKAAWEAARRVLAGSEEPIPKENQK